MLATLFGKKKLTEDKTANIFVNSLIQVVESSFPDIVDNIKSDGEFIETPSISTTDSDKFLMIVLAGNLKYLNWVSITFITDELTILVVTGCTINN